MIRKTLTKKEEAVLKLVAEGKSRTEAIKSVYNCGSQDSVYVLTNKMFKRPVVKERLILLTDRLNQQIVGKTIKMIQAIDKYLPIDQRGEILANIAKSDDKRSVLQAMDMIIRLGEGYQATKSINLNADIYQEIELGKETFDEVIEVPPTKKEEITKEG